MRSTAVRLACAVSLAAALGCATQHAPGPARLVDLTHPFDRTTLYWPTDTRGFELEVLAHGTTPEGFFYAANRFCTAEHGGTHIDAPIHFSATGQSVDQIPLSRLVAPAVVVDVSERAAADPDHAVTRAELERWEALHGRIPAGAIVLLRTGWGARWGDRARYLGTARTGPEAIPELHFPGLHPAAATWLATERAVAAVGIDTASIDPGQSKTFEAHQRLFAHQVPAMENLANLDALPPTGLRVVALPMKIAGGSGGPLRAIAILD